MKAPVRRQSSSSRPARRQPVKETVLFEYFDPSANIVAVVGDFNQWKLSAKPMKRDSGGLWTVKVRLAPGRYQYKFVINGERWEEDPLNLHRVMNEHGTFNSLRTVGRSSDGNLSPTI